MIHLRQEWTVALVVVALCAAVIAYTLVVRHGGAEFGVVPTTTLRP